MKVVTVEQMRQFEAEADAAGHTYADMMLQAGEAVAQAIAARFGNLEGKSVLILAGSGNNGGDGLVTGELLAAKGAQVGVYLTVPRTDTDPHLARLRERGVLIAVAEEDQRSRVLKLQLGKADLVIDAVLGTGFQLPLRGTAQQVLGEARRALTRREPKPTIVAVDCPSGVDCDTGEAANESLAADLTVTLAAAKPGLLKFPGAALVGEIVIGEIGLDAQAMRGLDTELITPQDAATWLPSRPRDAHKGTFGRALIVAGSINYPGAAVLAALGAYRAGAGLVTVAVPESIQAMLAPQIPEATWIPLPDADGFLSAKGEKMLSSEWGSTEGVLMGPGFGLAAATGELMQALVTESATLPAAVVDADGLKHLVNESDWPSKLPPETILTPHPGEMSVLTGAEVPEIQSDRVDWSRKSAEQWGHVVVLKGAHTVIAAPTGGVRILPFATPALARAGTGDVLSGILVGLLAQGIPAYDAAALGGYIHGRAGELAALKIGTAVSVLAGDVAAAVPGAIGELEAVGS